jgi:hypothetical protein
MSELFAYLFGRLVSFGFRGFLYLTEVLPRLLQLFI